MKCDGRNWVVVGIAVAGEERLEVVVGKHLVALEKAVVVGADSTGRAWFGLVVMRREEVRSVAELRWHFLVEEDSIETL